MNKNNVKYTEGDVVLFDHTLYNIPLLAKIIGFHESDIILVQLLDYTGQPRFKQFFTPPKAKKTLDFRPFKGFHEFTDTNRFLEIRPEQLRRKYPYFQIPSKTEYTVTCIKDYFEKRDLQFTPLLIRLCHIYDWTCPPLNFPFTPTPLESGDLLQSCSAEFSILWHYRDFSSPDDPLLVDIRLNCILPLANSYTRNRYAPLHDKLSITYNAFFIKSDVQAALEEFPSTKEGLIDPAAYKLLNDFYSDLRTLDTKFAPAAVASEYLANFRNKVIPDFMETIDTEDISTSRKRKLEEGYAADDEEEDDEEDDEGENESFITSASGSEITEQKEEKEDEETSWNSADETEESSTSKSQFTDSSDEEEEEEDSIVENENYF